MKEIIALLVFISLVVITIYLSVTKAIDIKLTIALLCFAIISGFAISNYDIIQKFKWGDLEVETAKREISGIKEEAIKEIQEEVDDQKESIKFLINNANDTRDKIEAQKESLQKVIDKAQELQSHIEKQKQQISELNNVGLNTKTEIEKLNKASAQIALILIRTTYFFIETKSEFGTERATMAINEILNDLNKILPMVISNPVERRKWINDLQNKLPKRK
ncbi:MAG: hypothetical protein MUP85_01410 [Candidatus Lokiarchaeota archaeon]|nr:hypothetical protein [Candidatus Lokiarchaeota archaeon]